MRPQSSASMKQLLHFAEVKMSEVFKEFDYGDDETNLAHYPKYKGLHENHIPYISLTKAGESGVPIAMFVGK